MRRARRSSSTSRFSLASAPFLPLFNPTDTRPRHPLPLLSLPPPLFPSRIQWRFALLGLLTAAATWLQIRGWHVTTFVVSLLVSATVSTIYYIIRVNHRPTAADELLVHLPFSLYHAWALVLVVLSGFDAFGVDKAHHPAGVWTKVFVFLALMFLETSAVGCGFPRLLLPLPSLPLPCLVSLPDLSLVLRLKPSLTPLTPDRHNPPPPPFLSFFCAPAPDDRPTVSRRLVVARGRRRRRGRHHLGPLGHLQPPAPAGLPPLGEPGLRDPRLAQRPQGARDDVAGRRGRAADAAPRRGARAAGGLKSERAGAAGGEEGGRKTPDNNTSTLPRPPRGRPLFHLPILRPPSLP